MIDIIVSSMFQLAFILVILFSYYFIKYRTKRNFLKSIGMFRTKKKSIFFSLVASILILIFSFGIFFLLDLGDIFTVDGSTVKNIVQLESSYLIMIGIVVTSFVKTGLSEELLFRGFIAKRLINKWGFVKGNLLQSIIFGGTHGLIFLTVVKEIPILMVIILATSFSGYILGFLNEKIGNGSIIPSWIAHGLANTFAWTFLVFL